MSRSSIPYTFNHSRRARRVRVTVKCDASVVLTAPRWVPVQTAEEFLRAKMDWVREKVRYWIEHPVIQVKRTVHRYHAHQEAARQLVTERIAHFNSHYQFNFNRVAIRRGRTRWGSCSRQKNLNFNFKLLWLPRELADYVVVHELCHLREMNHSKKFWALVAQTMPEHRKLRRELKIQRL